MNIFEKLKALGYDTVPESFYGSVDVWQSWYDGNVARFHQFRVFNGMSTVKCRRYSLGMANKVAADWANLLMNEKVKITLEGQKEQDFFDAVCQANQFMVKANEMQELKCALGTVAYVPTVSNVTMQLDSGEVTGTQDTGILLEYVTAHDIYPLSWDSTGVKECAFTSTKTVDNSKYLYLQIHKLAPDGNYMIENRIYRNQNGSLTDEELGNVRGFESVPPVIYTGSPFRQFVIDRPNIANNVDVSLPMGIAVYANAIDNLKGVDVAYDSYVNEFVLGKKRIIVMPEATTNIDGNPIFDENDLTFYVLPEDQNATTPIKEIDMTLRTTEHNTGIQDMLNALSSKCGFGENHYKFDSGSIATATQVISENSSLFRTIKKHEIVLESVLTELCRIILRLGNTYMAAGLNEDVEISIDFDDSIIEDKATEFERDSRMVSMGVMNAWEFRAKWMNEDEATAKAALPQMESLVNDPNA